MTKKEALATIAAIKKDIKIRKDMIERVKKQGTVDTAKYRYWMKNDRIYRIEREHLGTTAAICLDDDFCPNGWQTVYKFC